MDVEQRMRICRLIEKMNRQETYSIRLGLENVSRFREKKVKEKKGEVL
ncbi:hypothetical protein JQM69_01140 [Faecalicatena contorta]|nr:hypothetical protein [Faecalicatena contorta]MCF2679323.1 hypothetical protein [Faecalicatena contorta]